MATFTETDIAGTIEQLQAEIAELSRRLAAFEVPSRDRKGAEAPVESATPLLDSRGSVEPGITEEELLAVSAAIAAYLGVRAHIRQIRLLSTNAWAQQGRVSIQASHTLQG
jgi:methylmalonyl-CoA carboxyltransferase 12S subunit